MPKLATDRVSYYAEQGRPDQLRIIWHAPGLTPTLIYTVSKASAAPFAASLLAEAKGGSMGIVVACPLCGEGLLTIGFDPGEREVRYYADGSGQPGTPASIEGLEATCDCWPVNKLDEVFEGIPYEQWICEWEIADGFPTRASLTAPLVYRCLTYNRLGKCCPKCGHEEPEGSHHSSGATDDHPVYTALWQIVSGYHSIAGFFEAEAEAGMYRALEELDAERPKFYPCGGCGSYHPAGFDGDCRDNANRFAGGELDERFGPDNWEEVGYGYGRKCPLCDQPCDDDFPHEECSDLEQASADREAARRDIEDFNATVTYADEREEC